MSESENKDLLEALNSVKTVEVGDVVKGEILAFDDQNKSSWVLKVQVLKALCLLVN